MTFGAPFRPLPQPKHGSMSIDAQYELGRSLSQESAMYAQLLHTMNDYRRIGSNTPPSLEINKTASAGHSPVSTPTHANTQSTVTPPPPPISADMPISIENVCDDDPPLSRVFVRCNQSFTKDELQDLFDQYGEVQQLKLITIKATNKFKGKLFVKYAKASSAAMAIEELNGKEAKGSALTVQLAESYRTSVERRALMVDEADYPPFSRLFITCPPHLTYQELHKIFSDFGGVQHIVLLKDKFTQASRGLGFVKYSTASAASLAATHFSKQQKDQLPIMCRIAEPRSTHRSQKAANLALATPEEPFYENTNDASYSANDYAYDAGQQENLLGYAEQLSDSGKQSLIEYLVQLAVTASSHKPVECAPPQYPKLQESQPCDCEECLTSALLLLLTNQSQNLAPANPSLNENHLSLLHRIASHPDKAPRLPAAGPAHTPSKPLKPSTAHQGMIPANASRAVHASKSIPTPQPLPFPALPIAHTPAPFPTPNGPVAPMPGSMPIPPLPLVSPIVTSGPFPPDSRLFITFARQLPPEILQSVFGQYGTLAYAYLLSDRNYGFVQYYTAASAKLAIEALNNRSVLGVPCRVLIADPYTKKKPQQPMMMPTQEDHNSMIERVAEYLAMQGQQFPGENSFPMGAQNPMMNYF